MRIHYLQHVPFEGPAAILDWARQNLHHVTATQLFNPDEKLPSQTEFDMLVVMGGPMGVYDTARYSWLNSEAEFIRKSIRENKPVLGICLGAQLMASALGAQVKKNPHREIGWFPLLIDPALRSTSFADVFTDNMPAFHWHGDTFDLPENATRIASTEACNNQGFVIDDRVIGLQFHLETTIESAQLLIENCRDELDGSTYVQSEHEMLNDTERFSTIQEHLFRLLDRLTS